MDGKTAMAHYSHAAAGATDVPYGNDYTMGGVTAQYYCQRTTRVSGIFCDTA